MLCTAMSMSPLSKARCNSLTKTDVPIDPTGRSWIRSPLVCTLTSRTFNSGVRCLSASTTSSRCLTASRLPLLPMTSSRVCIVSVGWRSGDGRIAYMAGRLRLFSGAGKSACPLRRADCVTFRLL